VLVLSRLFRRLMLEKLDAAHRAGQLQFFNDHAALAAAEAFAAFLAPLKKLKWYVYAKPPFGGPEAVLAYLARYTHRVAIANSRLIAADKKSVTFRYKDYDTDGRVRYGSMTLATPEFIRRFLLHVLPKGFHRIRHYGLLARPACANNLARARALIGAEPVCQRPTEPSDAHSCPCCGGRMLIIETFARNQQPRHQSSAGVRIDTS
jgi:hypothetical protein